MPKIKYTSPEEDRTINEGFDGRIKCSAIGVPPPKYSWFKVKDSIFVWKSFHVSLFFFFCRFKFLWIHISLLLPLVRFRHLIVIIVDRFVFHLRTKEEA